MRLVDLAEVETAKDELEAVVRAWCEMKAKE
jgi:hypothetical protein